MAWSGVEEMLAAVRREPDGQPNVFAQAIGACSTCVTVCTMCADACTLEPQVQQLRRCIRLNLDCADLCATVSRILSRNGLSDITALRDLLEACISLCASSAAECQKHAVLHEHCRVCAEACATCQRECHELLETLLEGPSA